MTRTQGDLAGLSRFIFRAPSWPYSVAVSLFLAAFAGIAAFDTAFVLEDAWQGVFFIGVPTVTAAFLTTPLDRRLGGQLTYNRSSLLAFFCEFVVVALLVVAGVVAALTGFDQNFVFDVLIAALALVFAIRLLVVLAISRNSLLIAAVPASIQTGTAALLLFVYSGTINFLTIGGPLLNAYFSRPEQAPVEITYAVVPKDFVLLALMCLLYGGVAYGFLVVIDRPWRRSLDVSVLDFLRGFVGHIAEGSRELEDFFEHIGEEAVVPVTVLSFRDGAGVEKARWVLPMIHPGPMGEIGGGNLPQRVAETADGLAFPPHATAGHDFNLVTEREVETLIDAANRAYERIEYTNAASRSVRSSEGDATILGQRFGDDALLVSTFAPKFADDVEYAVGLAASAEARVGGLDDVLLVDAHNSNDGLAGTDLGHVYPGSKRSFDMMQAAGGAARDLLDSPDAPIGLGIAWDRTPWRPEEGIGPLGIRIAVIEVDGQRTAYVLVDGNNMEPGLRDRIRDGITTVDDLEVMTTDTHVVNTVEADNQVGAAIDNAELVDRIRALVDDAIADVEPVEAGMATERADVIVFGNDRTETLASHANAVIAMGGALAAAIAIAVIAVSMLVFFLT
jgi:putative membrane protein